MAEQQYFFCGVAGSGMLPLASYLQAQGARVSGSDRSFDQGRLPEKKAQIEELGIVLHPQDGSGLTGPDQILVTSAAVEATIPDVAAAERVGARWMTRAEVLSGLANAAPISVGIAGTSGKSTTTAMLAHILIETGRDPAIINGAGMLNVRGNDGAPLGWRAGKGPFLCEVDESDGSIDLYRPSIGVILNISEDHKSMAELEAHFSAYHQRSGSSVLGVASPPVAQLAASAAGGPTRTFAAYDPNTNDRPEIDFYATDLETSHTGVS
ncbi:MAG: Mur ligase domain-containing protein, partial [Pseudomonadota bacterium]